MDCHAGVFLIEGGLGHGSIFFLTGQFFPKQCAKARSFGATGRNLFQLWTDRMAEGLWGTSG